MPSIRKKSIPPVRAAAMAGAACLIVTFLGLTLFARTHELERGKFTALYQSVRSDLDLNIINQVTPPDSWLVTQTYNHPTHLDHGVALVWSPFYLLAEEVAHRTPKARREIFGLGELQVMGIARNAFFIVFVFLLLAQSCALLASGRAEMSMGPGKTVLAVLLATPVPWYLWLQPFNTEITILFLSAIFIYTLLVLSAQGAQSKRDYFLIGTFLGVATTTKVSMILLAPAVLAASSYRFSKTVSQKFDKSGGLRAVTPILIFTGGLFSVLLLLLLNHRVQFGEWILFSHFGLAQHYDYHRDLVFPMLFGWPNSLLGCSPIFIVTLATVLWKWRTQPHALKILNFTALAFVVILASKLAGLVTYPDELVSRLLVPLIPIIACQASWVWCNSGRWARGGAVILWFGCFAVNWVHIAEFMLHGELHAGSHYGRSVIGMLSEICQTAASRLTNLAELQKVLEYWPQLLAVFLFAAGMFVLVSAWFKRSWVLFLSAWLGYLLITALNLQFNFKNVQELAQSGHFKTTVVSRGGGLNHYDEILSVNDRAKKFLDSPWKEVAQAGKERFILQTLDDVEHDPIGFVRDSRNGVFRESRD